jgi:polysaccharide deacetylase 2 family uncharacterized protein YibQ
LIKRKSKRKKNRSKKARKKVTLRSSLLKAVAGIVAIVVLVIAAGLIAHYLIPSRQPTTPVPTKAPVAVKTPPKIEKPTFEIYPKEKLPIEKPLAKPKIPPKIELPRVAIIIDDLGYDKKIAEKFLELDAAFTFAILPFSPFQKKIAKRAQENGLEVMLHLPMEPVEYPGVDPGPGTLLTSMSPDQLISQLKKNLDTLPTIKGVNNHMGSKLTTESSQLYQIFSILKKRGLFFVDSRTTAKTLCKPSARMFKVPFAQRDVFIDHQQEPEFIRKQINKLIHIAKRHGEAVGIAHPHSTTYTVLKEMLPELKKNVQLVPALDIVRIIE